MKGKQINDNCVQKVNIRKMEKTESLLRNDSQICQYFEKYSTGKKENFCCYDPDRRQIADFYRTMNDHFYHQKL